jgi:hypothetical protein
MKNKLLLTTLFLLSLCATAWSQVIEEDDSPEECVVWSVDGEVMYGKAGDMRPLKASEILSPEGKIKIGPKSSAVLIIGEKRYSLDQEGEFMLTALPDNFAQAEDPFSKSIAMGFFGIGGGGGGSGQGSRGGAGEKDRLSPITPRFGKLPLGKALFTWCAHKKTGPFTVRFFREGKNEPIFSTIGQGSFMLINLKKAGLEEGGTYFWEVEKIGDEAGKSKRFTVEIVAKNKAKDMRKELKQKEAYKNAEKWERLLREAYAYQTAEMPSNALQTYQKAMEKNGDNPAVQQMHNAFLDQYDACR